jgi:hypothetical protein
MTIFTRLRFIEILDLPNKSERLLCALSALRECSCLSVCCEGKVIVTALLRIRSATLGVAPHSILQNVIPDVSSTGLRQR